MRVFPLPLLALSFAAGIATADAWPMPALPLLCAACLAFCAVYTVRRCSPPVLLASLCVLALLLGAFWLARDREAHPDLFRPWREQRVEITGTVLDEPSPGTAGWRCRVQVCRLRSRERDVILDAPLQLITEPAVRLSPGVIVRASGFLHSLDAGSVNFDTFDYARYAARSHLTASLRARTPFIQVQTPPRLRPDRRLALALRERLAAVHRAALPEADAALLNSLVFGSRGSPLPDAVEREFRDAGVVHVLVASGTQVTLFVGILFLLLRCLLLPWWARCAAALAGSWLFTLMAGGSPSIVRAGLVAVAVAAAGALGRESDPLSLLAFAALAILFIEPETLFDLGFQLSFAAVGGLILLQPALARCLPALPRPARLLFSASLAAQLYTLPISAHFFCQAAPVGVLANLIAVPLA
ncbi:MAG TPA: ComEC/Rec2 family competence protein, partial [Armatimonadota bacterium]|nr:ComEC/Rec2 family competence protein [Armatimonadota bacterium]